MRRKSEAAGFATSTRTIFELKDCVREPQVVSAQPFQVYSAPEKFKASSETLFRFWRHILGSLAHLFHCPD